MVVWVASYEFYFSVEIRLTNLPGLCNQAMTEKPACMALLIYSEL
jgi:hypothetical protein